MYRNCNYNCKINNDCNCNSNNDNDYIETSCECVQNSNDCYDECNCGFNEEDTGFPQNPMLAQSYVPLQTMNQTFKPCIGLKMGTIFPELVSPYMPGQSQAENEFIAANNSIKEGCNRW